MIGVVLALALAADAGDTAVIVRVDVDAATIAAQCPAELRCVVGARVDDAIADANSLGLRCRADDVGCWRRFVAAESFERVLVVDRASALLVGRHDARNASASSPIAAVDALFAPPPTTPTATATATAATAATTATTATTATVPPAPPAPPPTTTTTPATTGDAAIVPLTVAGVGAAAALGTGVAAAIVSADLNHSLDEAAARQTKLVDYHGRSALFFALAATSVVSAAAAGIGAWAAWDAP